MSSQAREDDVYVQYKYNRKPRPLIEKIIGVVNRFPHDATIASVGCGDGYVESYIQERTGRGIIGVDVSPKGVEEARKRGLEVQLGSAYELPFEDDSVDCLLAVHMFEHLTTPDRFLAEARRVLKNEGSLFISLPNYGNLAYRAKYLLRGSLDTFLQIRLGHFRHFTYEEAHRFVEMHGFRVTDRLTFLFGGRLTAWLPYLHRNWFSFSTLLVMRPGTNV